MWLLCKTLVLLKDKNVAKHIYVIINTFVPIEGMCVGKCIYVCVGVFLGFQYTFVVNDC